MKDIVNDVKHGLTPKGLKKHFHPDAHLFKMMLFAFVAAVAVGFFWSFFNEYLTGSRASTDQVASSVTASQDRVDLREQFTVNVVLAVPGGRTVTQIDLRMDVSSQNGGDVSYLIGQYESARLGDDSGTQYFDTTVIEEYENERLRLVLSAQREEGFSDRVMVQIPFRAESEGLVNFSLIPNDMEIVGLPGSDVYSGDPVSYSIAESSVFDTSVLIGDEPVTPTPTITLAPAPTCATTRSLNDGTIVCDDGRLTSMNISSSLAR